MSKAIRVGVSVAWAAAMAGCCTTSGLQREQQQQRVQLEKIASQQEQIRQALSQPRDALAGDRASLLMRQDLAAAAAMRVAVAEYYASMGKMPATNAEAGLPAPDQYRGKSLRSATLLPGGRIELAFDAQSGIDGGRVLLVPDLAHANAMGIQWRCETPDYPLIQRAVPLCDYKP